MRIRLLFVAVMLSLVAGGCYKRIGSTTILLRPLWSENVEQATTSAESTWVVETKKMTTKRGGVFFIEKLFLCNPPGREKNPPRCTLAVMQEAIRKR